jgi:hypothetical protein
VDSEALPDLVLGPDGEDNKGKHDELIPWGRPFGRMSAGRARALT